MVALAELATGVVALFHAVIGLLTVAQVVFDSVIVPVLWLVGL